MLVTEIRRVKAEKGLTNQAIALITDVPVGTINRIVSEGSDNISYYNAGKIARGLGISLDKCLGIQTSATDTPEPPVFVPPLVDVVEIVEPVSEVAAVSDTAAEPEAPTAEPEAPTAVPEAPTAVPEVPLKVEAPKHEPGIYEALYNAERREKRILFLALVAVVGAVLHVAGLQAIINMF